MRTEVAADSLCQGLIAGIDTPKRFQELPHRGVIEGLRTDPSALLQEMTYIGTRGPRPQGRMVPISYPPPANACARIREVHSIQLQGCAACAEPSALKEGGAGGHGSNMPSFSSKVRNNAVPLQV